jgi:hypothetical protein
VSHYQRRKTVPEGGPSFSVIMGSSVKLQSAAHSPTCRLRADVDAHLTDSTTRRLEPSRTPRPKMWRVAASHGGVAFFAALRFASGVRTGDSAEGV